MQARWKSVLSGMILAGVVALLAIDLSGLAQNRSHVALARYVMLEHEAIIVESPIVIAGTTVKIADWSPDGRHVVALRTDMSRVKPNWQQQEPSPAVEMSLVLWNMTLRRSFSAWKHSSMAWPRHQAATNISWLVGSQTALLPIGWSELAIQTDPTGVQKSIEVPHNALLLIDTTREEVRELPMPSNTDILTSPTKPQFLLYSATEHTVRIGDKNGDYGPLMPLPRTGTDFSVSAGWTDDGSALLLSWFEPAGGPAKGGMIKYARMDITTGEITKLDKATRPTAVKTAPKMGYDGPLHVLQTSLLLHAGDTAHRTHPLWLESSVKSEQRHALLCADAADGKISPRGDAALFISQGAAWAVPLTHAPRDVFTKTLRAIAMSNAKQAGLAVMMYCQDYDEMMPSASDHLNDAISPYIKNDEVLDGLNYTYGGGALGDIKDPKSTVLGTYGAPGGTVIIYADGHVEWKDK